MADDPGDALDVPAGAAEAVARIARNAESIAGIPWEELPDSAARACLMEMAYAGGDVSAVCAADGRWKIRLESRWESCAEWAARFRE